MSISQIKALKQQKLPNQEVEMRKNGKKWERETKLQMMSRKNASLVFLTAVHDC